jgi:Domain of Unknown Function (DUF748)
MKRFWPRFGMIILALAVSIFVASYFLDPIVRTHVENAMNEKLHGYQTRLARAHLQLLNGALTLSGLTVIQKAHPRPPVADIPRMRISIKWSELFSGHVVAKVVISKPRLSVNLAQLDSEKSNKVPIKNEGWQQAIQNIYPFKIDRFEVHDGDLVYTDVGNTRPLRIEHLQLQADNIRNLHSPSAPYPSPIHMTATVFNTGHAQIDGKANFLTEPSPSWKVAYRVDNIRLSELDKESQRVNFRLQGGVIKANGTAEDNPHIERVDLDDATIDGLNVEYFHKAQTAAAEERRASSAKQEAQKVDDKPGVLLHVRELNIINTRLAYQDDSKNPPYNVYISDLQARIRNLGNHSNQGPATIVMNGQFMGSGATTVQGNFRPDQKTADMDGNISIQNVDLTSLNNVLLAMGRFDVSSGTFSLYSQVAVRNGYANGYVKPMFGNLQVYNHQKDKGKPILHQVYEVAIGGAAKLLKNSSTQKVATRVDISGPLDNPDSSSWQAFLQLLRNAFIKAILPGFDRQAAQAQSQSVTYRKGRG